jgi:hypothetical protein
MLIGFAASYVAGMKCLKVGAIDGVPTLEELQQQFAFLK